MSELVPMYVKCIGKECALCRDLEIDNAQYILGIGKITNNLFCKNYEKCECIKEHILKESEKQNEQK